MFERQRLHVALLALLLALMLLARTRAMSTGDFRGLSANTWFGLSIGAAVVHQVYV